MINEMPRKPAILNLLFSLTAFLGLSPYIIWHEKIFFYYVVIVITVNLFLLFQLNGLLDIQVNDIYLLLLSVFIVVYFASIDIETVIQSLMANLALFTFILMPSKQKKAIYKSFSYIFAVSLIPSIIIYFFHQFNINFNWSYLESLNPLKSGYYEQYFGAVIYTSSYSDSVQGLYRLQGMFDEPGVLGTISALLLITDKFRIKRNFKNILLLIGGILSFSLAFYMLILIYIVVDSVINKNLKTGIIVVFSFILLGLIGSGVIKNDYINDQIVQRILITDEGLQGDNRTSEYFDVAFEFFLNENFTTVFYGMGRGATASDPQMAVSSSWKRMAYDNGFFGIGLLIFFLVIVTIKHNRTKEGAFVLLVLLLTMYQRPSIFNLSYVVIIIGGLENLKSIGYGLFDKDYDHKS